MPNEKLLDVEKCLTLCQILGGYSVHYLIVCVLLS